MRRLPAFGAMLLLPVLGFFLASSSGCKRGEEAPPATTGGGAKKPGKAAPRTALEASYDGVIKGRVTYDGDPPEMEYIKAMKDHKNKEGCLAGSEKEQKRQTWMVNPKNKGVANIVVWLEAPKDKYFKFTDEAKANLKKEVVLDQPHCAFVPHVVAIAPVYFDGKTHKPTGQVFKVKNSADFPHNTKWQGDPLKNREGNETLPANSEKKIDLKPQATALTFACDFHPWMNAYGWVFDHPYFAVTDENGEFEIRNVPTGTEVRLYAWHEAEQKFKDGEAITFKKGDNTLGLKVKASK